MPQHPDPTTASSCLQGGTGTNGCVTIAGAGNHEQQLQAAGTTTGDSGGQCAMSGKGRQMAGDDEWQGGKQEDGDDNRTGRGKGIQWWERGRDGRRRKQKYIPHGNGTPPAQLHERESPEQRDCVFGEYNPALLYNACRQMCSLLYPQNVNDGDVGTTRVVRERIYIRLHQSCKPQTRTRHEEPPLSNNLFVIAHI